jgi:hypothetical protein
MGLAMGYWALAGLPAQAQKSISPYEAIVKDILEATQKMTTVLVTIQDAATAANARPELKKAAEKFIEVRKKAEELKQPNLEERERVSRAYRTKLEQAVNRFLQERSRVAAIPGGRDALQELAGLEPARSGNPDAPKNKK